jgi:hypothetical protein
MLQGRGEKKQGKQNEWRILQIYATNGQFSPVNMLMQHLPRAFEMACGPQGSEDVSWQKICLSVDSAQVRTARIAQSLLGEF